mgnify:CR=1 FL=1
MFHLLWQFRACKDGTTVRHTLEQGKQGIRPCACVPDTRVLKTMQEADLQQRLDNYVLILLDCHYFVLTPSHLDEAFN